MDATILSGRNEAHKRESRLVTAQVFRPLDERSEAKREKFAVKGRTRREPLPRSMRSTMPQNGQGMTRLIKSNT